MDKGFDAFGRHGVFRVESGDTSLHEQGREESRGTMTGLIVSFTRDLPPKMTYTSEEDELRAILLRLVLGNKLIGVCISKVQSRTGSLLISTA